MPVVKTKGAASSQGFGEFSQSSIANYIEDVFSTYLYTGNGATQTINNGIDLAGKGGLVWTKCRTFGQDQMWIDTVRGGTKRLISNGTNAEFASANYISSFSSTGYSIGSDNDLNNNTQNFASWTFRKQPKFFDVVTYTGNGVAGRQIAHSLGSVPGCIIIKCTSTADNWIVYHRSIGNTKQLTLNTTDAQAGSAAWNTTDPTSTVFTVGLSGTINGLGRTYVAYLFAHNAGGFGLTSTDNVISCGSYTASGSSGTVTLGYEPQWILIKNIDNNASGIQNWQLIDNMRGMPVGSNDNVLYPNSSSAEVSSQRVAPTATGFSVSNTSGNLWDNGAQYIYIAIRRGPMKAPTSGTQVFAPVTYTGDDVSYRLITSGFPTDVALITDRTNSTYGTKFISDRLRGGGNSMALNTDYAENGDTGYYVPDMANEFQSNSGIYVVPYFQRFNSLNKSYVSYQFKRAPGLMDVVCYTGTGVARTITHNLGVAPELIIVKVRSTTGNWPVWGSALALGSNMYLNTTGGTSAGNYDALNGNNTTGVAPTSTTFAVGNNALVNGSGSTYVAYLFATCSGVSKVGSYTGNGSTQTINCGFTGGARFVLIKRTDASGDWYVYDTARGMTTLTDPYLLMNSTATESATLGSVTTVTTGFAVNASILAAINTNGASYIFLAIA